MSLAYYEIDYTKTPPPDGEQISDDEKQQVFNVYSNLTKDIVSVGAYADSSPGSARRHVFISLYEPSPDGETASRSDLRIVVRHSPSDASVNEIELDTVVSTDGIYTASYVLSPTEPDVVIRYDRTQKLHKYEYIDEDGMPKISYSTATPDESLADRLAHMTDYIDNRNLETAMGLNGQPITLDEITKLDLLVRDSFSSGAINIISTGKS